MKIKACPFCGTTSKSGWVRPLRGDSDYRGTGFWVHCDKCDASGGFHRFRTRAIRLWNRRAPTQAKRGVSRARPSRRKV